MVGMATEKTAPDAPKTDEGKIPPNVHKGFVRRHWKGLLNVVTLVALVLLVVLGREQFAHVFSNLAHANIWFVLLIIPVEAWNYDAQVRLYRSLFATTGHHFSYRFFVRMVLELNFVNNVFPSGGVSGLSYLSARLKGDNVRASKTALVQLMKMVLIFAAFEVLLIIGMIVLAASGGANNYTILVGAVMTTLMVVGTFAFTFVVGSRPRINYVTKLLTRAVNKLIHLVRPSSPETFSIERAEYIFNELHENYLLFRKNPAALKKPLVYAFFADLTEVLSVYVVFLGFGHLVNFGAVILAYAVANLSGVISVLPGGSGIYEALMTGVLVVAGVPAALALSVTVAYRVLSMLIQMLPGYYFYNRTLNRAPKAAS
jgi:uncharacterized protein (TIRG00374 family)